MTAAVVVARSPDQHRVGSPANAKGAATSPKGGSQSQHPPALPATPGASDLDSLRSRIRALEKRIGGYEQTETDMVYGFLEQWWSPKSAEVVLQLAIFVFFATFCFGAGWLVLLQLEMRQIREDYGITSSTRAESLRSFFAAHFDYARGPVYGVYWLFAGVLFSVVSFCATLVGGFLLNFLGSMLAVAIGVLCAVYILFTTMGRTDKAFFAWLREDVCGGRTLGDGVRFVYARCLSSPLLQLLSLSGSRGREPGTAEGQPSDPVYAGREEVGPAGLPASDYYLCEEEIRLEEQRLALEHVKLRQRRASLGGAGYSHVPAYREPIPTSLAKNESFQSSASGESINFQPPPRTGTTTSSATSSLAASVESANAGAVDVSNAGAPLGVQSTSIGGSGEASSGQASFSPSAAKEEGEPVSASSAAADENEVD